MRIAHFNAFTPNKQGMYETIKELCVAQNKLGLDTGIFDPEHPKGGLKDGTFEAKSEDWAREADIYMIHSILPERFFGKRPTLFFAHGMPEALLHDEMAYDGVCGYRLHDNRAITAKTSNPKQEQIFLCREELKFIKEAPLTTWLHYLSQPWCHGMVTFWPRHQPIWKLFVPDKICEYVPGGIDLDRYSMFGKNGQQLEKERFSGSPTFLYADMWRYMKNPFFTFLAFKEVVKAHPNATYNGIACPTGQVMMWQLIIKTLGLTKNIPSPPITYHRAMERLYRGNDALISPVLDTSRVAKEAMSCGMPVLSKYFDFKWRLPADDDIERTANAILNFVDDWYADKEGIRVRARKYAEEHFDINNSAKGMVKIYDKMAGAK